MSRVLVFGSINMDLVVETSAFPRLGETLPGASFATHAGGKGANQAVAAARLGGQVTMLGPVDPARLLVCELVDGGFAGVTGVIKPDWSAVQNS